MRASQNSPVSTSPDQNPLALQIRWVVLLGGTSLVTVVILSLSLAVFSPEIFSVPTSRALTSLLAGGVISVAVFVALGWLIGGMLRGEIAKLSLILAQVASQQDLSLRIPNLRDEIGNLLVKSFNATLDSLQSTIAQMKLQTEERSQLIHASAEISRRLSNILDQDQLILAVVDELQQSFGFYHVHVYLIDAAGQNLRLAGGTGEVGQKLLEQHHSIPVGHGLVGAAAVRAEVVLAADTTLEPDWLPNPLLPDTRSEAALPIKLGGRVIGVLDVQQNVPGAITPEQAALLISVADQLSVAIQNARTYLSAQKEAAREGMINTLNQKILAAASVEELLQTTAKELSVAMNAEKSLVYLQRSRSQD